jgi:hypothetical protein
MNKNTGDIPTMEVSGIRHITKSAAECLCGYKWQYGSINRAGKSRNIAFRKLDSVNCEKCKDLYMEDKK